MTMRSRKPDESRGSSECVRASVRIEGLVQGVCYRLETRREARRLGATGWVRNRADGSVEGVFEGAREPVNSLIGWCRRGPPGARVKRVDVTWEAPTGEFEEFDIRF